VVDTVNVLMKQRDPLVSSSVVVEAMKSRNHAVPTPQYIRQVLHQDLGMRYRRVHKVQKQANSDRSMVLRKWFGQAMLQQMSEGRNIICCDETWIGETNFHRR
jgi:hypothetical protein